MITTVAVYHALSNSQIETYLAREPAIDSVGATKSEGLGIVLMKRM
jgi:predicted house-cleaning NTP pyrophosphatase (Maf/HAM1 superfamily)